MAKTLYTVQSGDTLSKIARDVLGDIERWRELAYINSLSQPYIIYPGQIIMVPVDDAPLDILVTKGQQAPDKPPATPQTGTNLPGWLVVGGLALALYAVMRG